MGKKVAKRTWFTPRQQQLLAVVSSQKIFQKAHFYLTGGTALAAVYYNHRQSEDLDFFSNQEFSDFLVKQILIATQPKLKWQKVERQTKHGHSKFLLTWPNRDQLLLDFNFWPYKPLFKPGGFIRKGKTGDHKTKLSADQEQKILQKARDELEPACLEYLNIL